MKDRISIIVPTLNEAVGIEATLGRLQDFRGAGHELVVADGGSRDTTVEKALPLADQLIVVPRGRALQMNRGAEVCGGTILWFLHADTWPPAGSTAAILEALADPRRCWGRFDVRLSGKDPMLRLVATMMNLRSRLSGIATGDQGIFLRRESFESIGGFPQIPLMEDIAISRTLRRIAPPACLRPRLVTSSRRWERRGTLVTIALMWRLRLAYALGADPHALARSYR